MEKLFPQFPDDIGSASREQLAELLEQSKASLEQIKNKEVSLSSEDLAKVSAEVGPAILAIHDELSKRDAADAEAGATVDDLLSKITPTAEERKTVEVVETEPVAEVDAPKPVEVETAEDKASDAEVEVRVEEPVAVAAAAAPTVYMGNGSQPITMTEKNGAWTITERQAPPEPTKDHKPIRPEDVEPRYSITAGADIPGIPGGSELDMESLTAAMIQRQRGIGMGGNNENVYVASIKREFPEDRIVTGDVNHDTQIIEAALSPAALTAAGGLCAPVTPVYDIPIWSQASRPLRASLPSFNAVRGGIKFVAPPALSSISTAVTSITAAADASGGGGATKGCQVISCPSFTEVDVNILASCLRWSNLSVRAFPELMENAVALTAAAYARIAETAILDAINTASVATTEARVLDIVSDLPTTLALLRRGFINRHRMSEDTVFRALVPGWVRDSMKVGILRGQFDRYDLGDGRVESLFTQFGIAPTFYQDSATSAGMLIGTQSTGAINGFPTTVKGYLFPEGSFLYVDGGSLDLGLVRDSTLNSTNEFTIFMEEFFNVAFRGIESMKFTVTTSDNGATSLPIAVSATPSM